jgi:hypothetical protein
MSPMSSMNSSNEIRLQGPLFKYKVNRKNLNCLRIALITVSRVTSKTGIYTQTGTQIACHRGKK